MQQSNPPQIPAQESSYYNRVKQEYAQIFKVFVELEDEKREHLLVQEAIKDLDTNRKCWRLVGGVLVERNVGEVLPSIKQNIEMLEKAIQQYQEQLNNREKELVAFEIKYGLKPDTEKQQQPQQQQNNELQKPAGVLA